MDNARRKLVAAGIASSLWWLSPGHSRDGRLRFMREAEAAWMMAASLALSAMSAFTRSDGGMGAMLSAMRELQEENIRLTHQVLASLANVQSSLAQLPTLLRETLRESSEFRVREETTDAFNRLLFLERERREGRPYRAEAADLVQRCVTLSRFQSVPHGIGGVGAMCAPIAATVDARARRLAGREASINNAIETFYLPWLRAMRSDQDGSLLARSIQAGRQLKDEIAAVDDKLSERSRKALAAFLREALSMDAGAPKVETVAECARVRHHYDTKRECEEYTEVGLRQPVSLRLDSGGSVAAEDSQIARLVCVRYRSVPQYRRGLPLDRIVSAQNTLNPLGSGNAEEPGPRLSIESKWVLSADPGKSCPDVISTTNVQRAEDIPKFIESSELKGWENELEDVRKSRLANINDLRQQLFAMHILRTSAHESESLLKRVTT